MSIYQSFESLTVTEQKSRGTTKVSFYSSVGRDELEEFIRYNYPPGYGSQLGGFVDAVNYHQKGPFWYADITIWWEQSSVSISAVRRPLHHSLRSIRISMPLSKKSGYKTKWDHFLWQRIPLTDAEEEEEVGGSPASVTLPDAYATAETDAPFCVSGVYYRWTKTGTELDGAPKAGCIWKCIASPTKPGVESWDYHTYQITESGEYHNEREAAWATETLLDRVRATPLLGDFGLSQVLPGSGWTWKCDDANVEFDGKHWVASLVWTLSGDASGWDPDFYDPASTSGSSISGSTSSSISGSSVASNSGTLGANMNWIEIT